MNISPQLTAQEFSDLHNAKCEIHGISETMEGVLHPDLQNRLQSAIAKINAALKNAYEQDDAISEKRTAHYDKVSDDNGFNTIWSVHEVDDLYMPHPFAGAATKLAYGDHWGEKEVVVSIEGDTWVDLWRAAEAAIKQSGDTHHIFIEGFKPSNVTGVLVLTTGS